MPCRRNLRAQARTHINKPLRDSHGFHGAQISHRNRIAALTRLHRAVSVIAITGFGFARLGSDARLSPGSK
jgi:hypothetical protein